MRVMRRRDKGPRIRPRHGTQGGYFRPGLAKIIAAIQGCRRRAGEQRHDTIMFARRQRIEMIVCEPLGQPAPITAVLADSEPAIGMTAREKSFRAFLMEQSADM